MRVSLLEGRCHCMAKKKKANRPLRWIIALTVIFCAAAVGSMVLTKTLSDQRTARLEAAREEVAAINEQRDQEYFADNKIQQGDPLHKY